MERMIQSCPAISSILLGRYFSIHGKVSDCGIDGALSGARLDLLTTAFGLLEMTEDLLGAAEDLPGAAEDLPGAALGLLKAARDLLKTTEDLPEAAEDLPLPEAAEDLRLMIIRGRDRPDRV